MAGSSLAGAPPNLNCHMSRPGHVALGGWLSRSAYPGTQTLSAVEHCRIAHDFPLAFHTVRITAAHAVVGFGSQLRPRCGCAGVGAWAALFIATDPRHVTPASP